MHASIILKSYPVHEHPDSLSRYGGVMSWMHILLFSVIANATPRIVAIGDLHGDTYASQKVLEMAGITNHAG